MARKKFRNSQRQVASTDRSYQEFVLNQPLPQTTKTELIRLIRGGEDTYLELKLKLSNSENIAQEIVALANTDGGTIVFGVTDQLLVQGLRYPERVQDELVRICREEIVPPLVPLLDTIAFDNGSLIIALDVNPRTRPYRTRSGRYYIRTGAKKHEASREELSGLLGEARPLFYENTTIADFDADDFDDGVLWSFVGGFTSAAERRSEYDTRTILKRDLLLAVGAPNEFTPTIAGILLFGRSEKIGEAVENSGIWLRRVVGNSENSDLIEEKYLEGNLLSLFDDSTAFIEQYCDLYKHRMKRTVTGEDPVLPRPAHHLYAVREAVCNLLVHRDLALRDAQTSIQINDDSIEFINPRRTLGFVPPASKAIRYGLTQRVNPQIAAIFARREYGTNVPNGGLPMVLKQAELFSGKKAELATISDQFRLKIYAA